MTLLAALVATGAVAVLALRARLALARQRELVTRACHELRQPLTAARLGLALAARGGDPRAAAVDRELERAAYAVADLAAALAGRRAPERRELVDAGAVAGDVARAWRPVAEALRRGLAVDCTGAALVRADRVRLAQACGNLVANALEHGAGDVLLRVRAAGRAVRVEVTDGGPGLGAPVPELARRAGRGLRTDRGRGLAITAAIAAAHGGRLSAAPSPRGARLVLELPAAAAGAEREAGP